jgi:hypothetical protein
MSDIVKILKSIGFKQLVESKYCSVYDPCEVSAGDWVYRDGDDDIYFRENSSPKLIYIMSGVVIEIADNTEEIEYYLMTMLRNKKLKEFNICWN